MRGAATSSSPHTVSPLAASCPPTPPPCLALAFYSSSPPFFFCTTSSAACSPFPPLAIHTILPYSSPLPSLFFFPPLPPFKRMHYFQPRLCGVDRESRTMAAFQSHDPVLERGGGEGGALAATIFFFSTVNSKQANAASLLLARLAKKTVD